MSYDVVIGDFDANYTSNVSSMWYDSIPDAGKGGGLRELDGLTGKEAHSVLSRAFDTLDRMYPLDYDAPNGWGSTSGALIFTARIMAACSKHKKKRVRVCS